MKAEISLTIHRYYTDDTEDQVAADSAEVALGALRKAGFTDVTVTTTIKRPAVTYSYAQAVAA